MTTVTLNKNNNAYPGIQVDSECAGYSLRGIREMRLSNFKTDREWFRVIVQFFDKDRYPLAFASIDHSAELSLQIEEQHSSYVIIINTNDGAGEVRFDLDLMAKN
jgi:hypothetical protein